MTITSPDRPFLSIVTPVHNAAKFVQETLRSVVAQIEPADQYIVVDDGSTDGSSELIECLGEKLEVIRQGNCGEIAAVNAGAAAARHDIVGIVNADDPILPELLNAVRNAFASDPDLAAVYPDWIKIDEDGRRLADVETLDFDYAVLFAQHMCIPGPGAFFRRSALAGEPVRHPDAEGLSDYDFWLRFARRGAKVRRLPQTLATWRLHRAGASISGQGAALAATKIRIIKKLIADDELNEDVRTLAPQALSAAYNQAALVGLRAAGVPSLRYAIKSYVIAPFWAGDVLAHQRRSFPHLAYAAMQPLSGYLHTFVSPCLSPRFRRQAVVDQVFGLDASPNR